MSRPLRLGGWARLVDGGSLTWSVAEGARGRRWREAVERDGRLVRALLLEVAPSGRPTRLELETAAGLLTLHPEPPDRELHGNVVGAAAVRHLRFEWGTGHELLVVDSPACLAVMLRRVGRSIPVGRTLVVPVVRVDLDLAPRPAELEMRRAAATSWRIRRADGGEAWTVALDEAGVVQLPDGLAWPLELD